jgi:hypothetical protein
LTLEPSVLGALARKIPGATTLGFDPTENYIVLRNHQIHAAIAEWRLEVLLVINFVPTALKVPTDLIPEVVTLLLVIA